MRGMLSLFLVLVVSAAASATSPCKGCVSLDEYNFEKIVERFRVVMVKFDVAYPYGDKHDAFTRLAEELSPNRDVVLAEVGIKDYGQKENEALAKKYGVNGKEDLPAVRLFVAGRDAPVEFPNDAEWTPDNLRNLIRDNTEVYVGLPGCVEELDRLAMRFAAAGDKEGALKEAQGVAEKLDGEVKEAAGTYLKFMKKIIETGTSFVAQEYARLSKILKEGKINEKKKLELSNRLNVLRSFALPKESKDEL